MLIVPVEMTRLRDMGRTLLFIASSMCCACAAIGQDEAALVAKDAYDIQRRTVVEHAVDQLTYKVHLDFPKQAIDQQRAEDLQKQGWIQCAAIPPWESFVDGAMQPLRTIHQSQRVFIKDKRLLMAGMQYQSTGRLQSTKPSNNVQLVSVLTYDISKPAVASQLAAAFPNCLKQ